MKRITLIFLGLTICLGSSAQDMDALIDAKVADMEEQVIEWRRHFHQYPELSNREVSTAKKSRRTSAESRSGGTDRYRLYGSCGNLGLGKTGSRSGTACGYGCSSRCRASKISHLLQRSEPLMMVKMWASCMPAVMTRM